MGSSADRLIWGGRRTHSYGVFTKADIVKQGHTIVQLLERGYLVRTTVRSASRGGDLRAQLLKVGADVARLETAIVDLMSPKGWDDAMAGVGAVMHLATPMQGDDVRAAAPDGTRRVREAAAKANVGRFIFTSTGLAASNPADFPAEGIITESHWTDSSRKQLSVYGQAKTDAERRLGGLDRHDVGRKAQGIATDQSALGRRA